MKDVYNDWRLNDSNDLDFASGSSAARLRLNNRLGTQQGEYRWDTACGVPWLFSILSQRGDSASTRQLIIDQIRQDSEVAATGDIQATFDNATRKISYQVSVRLVDGVNTTVDI